MKPPALQQAHPTVMQHFASFKAAIFAVGVLSLITNVMLLAPTMYMLQLYDRVMVSMNTLTLFTMTLILCFFLAVMALAEWLRAMTVIKAGVKFDQALNSQIFSLAFENALNSTANTARGNPHAAIQDLTQIRQFFTSNGLFAFFDMPWTMIYIAVLFIMHVWLGVLAVVFCAIQCGIGVWNQRSTDAPLKTLGEKQLNHQQFLESNIRNIDSLYVMGMIPNLYHRWQAMQKTVNSHDALAIQVQTRNQLVNKFVRYSMQSLMLATAALLAVQGQISIGAMIASNVLIARALQPFDMIVSTWKPFVQATLSIGRLNGLLKSAPIAAMQLKQTHTIAKPIVGEIVLKNLSLTLPDHQQPILKNLNLTIFPGQILTIMGHSGSGKTSLARCLVGIYATNQGELRIDGLNITQILAPQLAASIGYLPQDIELMAGTIAENIARFAVLETSHIIAAAKAVGLHDTILRLPQGYDTYIDEAGRMLSGGQQQLIGLARALYKDPAIVVLDEPNAHLDEYGEASLSNALLMLKTQGKTIVVISHRASLLKVTDQLLVMKEGAILHHGAKDVVLEKLHETQTAYNAVNA